jgi:hypothetical protein
MDSRTDVPFVAMRGRRAPRLLATVALALYWGLVALGSEFSFDLPRPLDDLWYSTAPILIGAVLAFAVGVYVGQWRILVVAVTPLVVFGALQLSGHVAPWHEAGPPLTHWWETNGWWPLFWELVFPLGLGVLVRRKGLAPATRTA